MIKYTIIVFGLFYCASAKCDVRDSVDRLALQKQIEAAQHFDMRLFYTPDDAKKWIEQCHTKGGWRWSAEEWRDMLYGTGRLLPEFYVSPEFGSNGGWILS